MKKQGKKASDGVTLPQLNFTPNRDRYLIKQDEPNEYFGRRSAIIMPESSKEKPPRGIILAAGDGRLLQSGIIAPLNYKAGDRIHFKRHAQWPIEVEVRDGIYEEFILVKEDDVLGVVKPR